MRRIYKNPLTGRVIASTKTSMEVTFDPAKDAINIAKHGLSLADAAEFEMSAAVIVVDDRYDYGEIRYRAFGRVDGEARSLVFTVVDGQVRAISYRRAHAREMRRYE